MCTAYLANDTIYFFESSITTTISSDIKRVPGDVGV